MKLRSRIMIITFLIILFVQGINCFLEIGFLANNLEESNLRKYRIVGNQMMRKLNSSLIFGKPLAQINFQRLLSGIVPKDADNLHIIDSGGNILYSLKTGAEAANLRISDSFMNEKTPEAYRIFFPLSDRTDIKGNLVIVISHREVKEKRFYLIRKSVLHFIMILALSLPLLYVLLTVFINRPYNRFIKNIETWLSHGAYDKLRESSIDLSPLADTEARLKEIRAAAWLSPEKTGIYEDVEGGAILPGKEAFEKRLFKKLKNLMQVN